MRGMDADFLATVGKTHIITARARLIEGGAAYDEMDDYFFLLSRSQVYGGAEGVEVDEGSPYPYYSEYSDLSTPGTDNDANRIVRKGAAASSYILRTISYVSGQVYRSVFTLGQVGYGYASNNSGVVPVCNVI